MIKVCEICKSETHTLNDPQIKVTHQVCNNCGFIYKDKEFHPTWEDESNEYLRHENSIENEGYVNLFKHIIKGYIEGLDIKRKVLEFGSGPNPVFKEILVDSGYDVLDYDPFYNPNEEYKKHKYQLITSHEVVEHFVNPIKEFTELVSLLEDDGYIVLSTYFRDMDEEAFLTWWYRRDITHLSFYNVNVFEELCKILPLKIVKHDSKKIIILQKIKENK